MRVSPALRASPLSYAPPSSAGSTPVPGASLAHRAPTHVSRHSRLKHDRPMQPAARPAVPARPPARPPTFTPHRAHSPDL